MIRYDEPKMGPQWQWALGGTAKTHFGAFSCHLRSHLRSILGLLPQAPAKCCNIPLIAKFRVSWPYFAGFLAPFGK